MTEIWINQESFVDLEYNNNKYCIQNTNDPSTKWSIEEIIDGNEYKLNNFNNIKNATFIDIGANCGIATIILAKQNPESTIISFEPDKKIFEFLSNNIKLNNLTNIILHNKAVSKKGIKTIKLYMNSFCSGANTTYSDPDTFKNFNTDKIINIYEVECISLDEIIDEYKLSNIELLKIDCEGAEYDILYNSNYFKNKIVKNIVGEFHEFKYNTQIDENIHNSKDLINYCEKYTNVVNISVYKL
jgi:FkbM family methyltransferase